MASTISAPRDDLPRQLVLFRLSSRTYGVALDAVREIMPYRQPTRLPGAPACIAGLLNVHGSVVTVVDLGLRLHDAVAAHPAGSLMLVEHGTSLVGVAVDEVLDICREAELSADAAPPLLDIHDVLSPLLA
ncbi:MAG TPA: chemotaxis protein CheW [Gemmatimonadaceae bacterium]|nr:chemotaxis protein CheW [Gemmatimonadaceae bacterium]